MLGAGVPMRLQPLALVRLHGRIVPVNKVVTLLGLWFAT